MVSYGIEGGVNLKEHQRQLNQRFNLLSKSKRRNMDKVGFQNGKEGHILATKRRKSWAINENTWPHSATYVHTTKPNINN